LKVRSLALELFELARELVDVAEVAVDRREAHVRHAVERARSLGSTRSPISRLSTSVTPSSEISRSTSSASACSRSTGTGRLVAAWRRPFSILLRSKGSRRPSALTTTGSASSMRS
jgi:hypothetical protein